MPVTIDIFDFKFFNQLRNGSDFDQNLTQFTPNLVGNVGEKVKVEFKANLTQTSFTEGAEEWTFTVISASTNIQIERSSGSFIDDVVQVGDVFELWDDWNGRRIIIPNLKGRVLFVSNDGSILRYEVLNDNRPTNGSNPFTNIGLTFNQLTAENLNTAFFLKFGLIGNDETFNFQSKVTDSPQIYYRGEIVAENPPLSLVNGFSLGVIKDWVTGIARIGLSDVDPDFKSAQYVISHEFIINPFYTLDLRSNINSGQTPELFAGDAAVKYALELEFRKTLSNTGSSKLSIFDQLDGFVGWYSENFNGLNSNYSVASISYEEASSAEPLEAVNINTSTVATIVVNNALGAITDYSCAVYIIRIPDSEDDYIGTTSNLIENFIYKSEIINSPATSNPNVNTSLQGGNLVIEYTIDYTTAEKLRLSTDDEYILLVQVEDPTIDAGNSDRVMIIVDLKNYVDLDFISSFINVENYGFLIHGQQLGQDTLINSPVLSNEDGILLSTVFSSDTSKNVIINSVDVSLIAYNETENKSFELDNYSFSIGDLLLVNGSQVIEVDTTRGYPLPSEDQFNLVKILTLAQNGNFSRFQLVLGQKIKWQEWIFNSSVDSVFFDSNEPNNNLNDKSSNYSGLQGYEIKVALILSVSGVDDLGRSITGDFINFGGSLSVNDYDESTDNVSGVIETFDTESGNSLQGNILYNGKDTLFKATFQNASLMQYGIHRIEPSQNQGDGILELSNLLPSVPNNILKPLQGDEFLRFNISGSELVTECLIDGSLIQEGIEYKLSARVGSLPISLTFFSEWNTANVSTGSSANNQIKLPLISSGNYNFIVDWGDGSQDTITQWDQIETTHTYATSGIKQIQIGGVIRGWGFGGDGDRLKILDISQWGDFQVTNNTADNGAFEGCSNLDISATDIPDFSLATNLSGFFSGCVSLIGNSTFNDWDVSQVLSLGSFFSFCSSFNQVINNWQTGNVTVFRNFLFGASSYTQSLNDWDVSSGVLFENMLRQTQYNSLLNNWVISSAANMNTFLAFTPFNQNINNWVLPASLTRMQGFFLGCTSYNQPLNSWGVSNVQDFGSMFSGASVFNQDLSTWITSSATNFRNTFARAFAFNSDISGWITNTVTISEFMFDGATSFNRNLSSWLITNIFNANSMFRGSSLNTANLDALLIGWASQAPNINNNVVFGAENTARSFASDAAVTLLTNTYGWTINTL